MGRLSNEELFEKVLIAVEAQLKNRKIRVFFGPSGKMRFSIDEPSLKEFLSGLGVEASAFRQVFDSEISPLMQTVLENDLESFARRLRFPFTEDTQSDTEQAQEQELIRKRGAAVEKKLVTPELRARYFIKVSSKHPRLKAFTWEIVEKRMEQSSKRSVSQPFVTLSIETIRTEKELERALSWFPLFPQEFMGRTEYATFDVDEGDLDEVIETLTEARSSLGRLRKGSSND